MDLFSILDGTPEPPIVALHLSEVNASGEYNLATPMFEFQKELTDQIVSLHYPDILKYCETNDYTELITKSMEICVENCSLVASHPYLLIRHYMPKNLGLKELPAKLAETSGKFSVLRNLMNVVIDNRRRAGPKNIAVVLRNESRNFDLTEALLLGSNGPKTIVRYVGNNVKKDSAKAVRLGVKDPYTTYIHLIPSDGSISRQDLEISSVRFDAFVVVDSSLDPDSGFVARLRRQNRRAPEVPAVLIRLVPMLSIEHCLIHYSGQKEDKSYLYKLISSIVCLRDQIGNLPPDLHPIYNQQLSYLSHTFFDDVFGENTHVFPSWPLPELGAISRFSPADVERSLLTESTYHYTPYDSAELGNKAPDGFRKSYYETKRLKSDYVTNPLRNDYNKLSGVHNHHAVSGQKKGNATVLTHLLISQLNDNYSDLALLKEEYDSYVAFNRPEKQRSTGRRADEIKKTLASIMEDVDHSQQRLEVTQRKILKRTKDNEDSGATHKRLKEEVASFAQRPELENHPIKKQYIEKQLKIWDLQHEVKALVATLQSKHDEKNYMKREVANCSEAAAESQAQAVVARDQIEEWEVRINSQTKLNMEADTVFQSQRLELLASIDAAKAGHAASKEKFAKTLAQLKDTSQLKKRKNRGVTPNPR